MNKHLLVLAVALPAYSAEQSTAGQEVFGNITQGHILTSGGVSFNRSYFPSATGGSSTQTTTFSVYPSLQYFVMDKLSVGGTVNFSLNKLGTTQNLFLDVGPAVTYFFWAKDRLAAKGSVSYLFNIYHVSDDSASPALSTSLNGSILNLTLGGDYFITPSVSFGPTVTYSFLFGDRYGANSGYSAALSFSIYL